MLKKLFLLLALGQFYTGNSQVIEDFEDGPNVIPTSIFRNQNGNVFSILNCNVSPQFGYPLFPSMGVNLSGEKVSIVTNGTDDPILLQYGYSFNVVSPNGDEYALRLNDIDTPTQDITSYKKKFTPESPFLSFDYMAVLDSDYYLHSDDKQPFFTARLLDSNLNIIQNTQFCLIAQPNDPLLVNQNDHLYYTNGWYCHTINIPQQYIGQVIFVEFIAADCGKGGDKGVAYIDNIINKKYCEEPVFGSIALDYQQYPCPESAFKVCGTYSKPIGTELESIFLEIKQNGNVINTLDLTHLIHFGDGTFCFKVTSDDFLNLPGNFEFNVIANFVADNGFIYTLSYESSFDGPDVVCNEVECQPIQTYIDFDNYTVTWNSTDGPFYIEFLADTTHCCPGNSFEYGGIYDYETINNSINFVELVQIVSSKCIKFRIRSQCSDWTDWCCWTSYYYEYPEFVESTPPGGSYHCESILVMPMNTQGRPAIVTHPNPTSNKLTVSNSSSKSFVIYDYKQKEVFKKTINEVQNEVELNLDSLKNGIYILKLDDGSDYKIIKE